MSAFDPLRTLAKPIYAAVMRPLGVICCIAALAAYGCDVRKVRKADDNSPAETAGPHFANLCLKRSDWPRLLATMRAFGAQHGLEMHGGIDDSPLGPMLNVYLAQGYSYYFGDDFDLWFVSDVSDTNVVYLNGVLKRKPITPEQQALAAALLSHLSTFTRRAVGPSDDPTCP